VKYINSVLLCLTFFIGCRPLPSPPSAICLDLQGNHLLRQVGTTQSTISSSNGSFFLFFGDTSSSVQTQVDVAFAWEGNDGVYRYTTLPLDKVRFATNKDIIQPFVKFKWTTRSGSCYTPNWDIHECTLYAVVGVNPKDWPTQISMPNIAKEPKQ
jgi:hypothetical protein